MPENNSSSSLKGRIFISYRRADSAGYAGRIYDRLVGHFGEDAIFMDVDTIEGGVDFIKTLEDAVQCCDVLIALIGRQWLNIQDNGGKRRLDNPEDFVRIEIATALKRNIRVIPVLVDGVDMPQSIELPENLKALVRRNALQVNHHSFNPDVYRLIEHTKSALDEVEKALLVAEEKARQKGAKEKAEREKTEKEAAEKARLEAEERARQIAAMEEERIRKEAIAKRRLPFYETLPSEKLEPEKPQPKKTKPSRKPNIAIIIALIVLVITISAALINSPMLAKLFSHTPEPATHTPDYFVTPGLTTSPTPNTVATATVGAAFTQAASFSIITASPTPLPTEITDAKGVSMVLVPASEFTMGFSADGAYSFCKTISAHIEWYNPPCRRDDYLREEPVHKVYLNTFYMDVFEVSNEEYKECVLERVCQQPSLNSAPNYSHYYDNENLLNYPALNVTWNMAKTYCEWRGARLPTEAEWEKAARGTDDRSHPWANYNSAYKLYDQAFLENYANVGLGKNTGPMSITSNSQGLSPYGLYNMAGNVAEWVADWYSETYYGISPYETPLGPSSGEYKVIRGGSYNYASDIRTTARDYKTSSAYNNFIGFRCARDANP